MENGMIARNPDVVDRRERDEALLFNPADGRMICLNAAGMFIWDLCDGTRCTRDIAEIISEEYDVSPAESEKDCAEFLEKLRNPGFIALRNEGER